MLKFRVSTWVFSVKMRAMQSQLSNREDLIFHRAFPDEMRLGFGLNKAPACRRVVENDQRWANPLSWISGQLRKPILIWNFSKDHPAPARI